MTNETEIQIWDALFNQTPIVVRWALGVLTLGVFTLASILYRWHRADVERLEIRVDQLETNLRSEMSQMNSHLLQIAVNTKGLRHD